MRLLRLAAALVLLALCVGVSPSGQAVPVPLPVPEAAAGVSTLRFPFAGSAPVLDPHRARNAESFQAASLIYDTLYMWVPATDKLPARVVPALAEGWPTVSEDGLTLTIKLRKGVNFHNHACFGKTRTRELTARDVVDSLKRVAVCGEEGMGWLMYTLVAGLDDYAETARGELDYGANDTAVEGLKAADDLTVVIKTTRPYAILPTMLAHPGFSILPREAINGNAGALSERAIGTGPYRLNAFAENRLVVLRRVADYWGEKPAYERVVFSFVRYWEGFVNGLADGTYGQIQVYPRYYDQVVKDDKPAGELVNSGGEVLNVNEHGYYFMAFNMQDPTWGTRDADGRKLRRALSLAVDRAAFMESVGWDAKWYAPQLDILPAGTLYADTAAQNEYGKQDLDAAKKLLDETKFKGGVDPATGKPLVLDLLSSDVDLYNAIVSTLRKALTSLGMRLTVRYVEGTRYRDLMLDADQQMFIGGWFLDYPDPVNFLQLFYSAHAGKQLEFSNNSRYANPDFDKAYDAYAGLTPNEANLPKLRELAATMTRLIAEDQPTIALAHEKHVFVRRGAIDWPAAAVQTYNAARFTREKSE